MRTDVGLKYPEDAESAIEQLSPLLGADLVDPSLETATATHVGAWSEASLSWLVGGSRPEALHRDISRVTAGDVMRLRATRDLFDRLDNQFGGGHARRALLEYLRDDLPNLLRAGASGRVHQDLFRGRRGHPTGRLDVVRLGPPRHSDLPMPLTTGYWPPPFWTR